MNDPYLNPTASAGQMRIYQTVDNRLKVEARLENASISLTRQQMAEWFHPSRPNVARDVQHIYTTKAI